MKALPLVVGVVGSLGLPVVYVLGALALRTRLDGLLLALAYAVVVLSVSAYLYAASFDSCCTVELLISILRAKAVGLGMVAAVAAFEGRLWTLLLLAAYLAVTLLASWRVRSSRHEAVEGPEQERAGAAVAQILARRFRWIFMAVSLSGDLGLVVLWLAYAHNILSLSTASAGALAWVACVYAVGVVSFNWAARAAHSVP